MAETGKQALEKLHGDNFTMIISDILIPVMDGYQLFQVVRINKKFNDIFFIFYTTTYVEEEDEEFALNLGANIFLRKPLEPEIFIKTIQNLIKKKEISQDRPKETIIKEEEEIFKLYSERLINKLEKKRLDLEKETTRRKKVEENIKEQNEFLINVINSLTHPFYVINVKDYTIEMANSAAKYVNPSVVSPCYALIHNRDTACIDEHVCPLEEVKKTKKPVTVEHIHYDPDNNIRIDEVHGYLIFDEDGNVIQMIGWYLDITEHKKAEKEILDLARFPSENPNPVLRVTKKIVIYTNKAGEELFNTKEGCSIPTILQKDILNVFSENTKQELDLEINNRIYSFIITLIMEAEYVNIYGRDITKRKKAEEKLEEFKKK